MNKLISLVIPAYNEEGNIPLIYEKISEEILLLPSYNFEIIFVNDGSTDNTGKVINSLIDTDDRVKYVEFSRNFDKEVAITAGIRYSTGDCIITLDADMQHPVALLHEFITKWELGAEIVIGIRKKNEGISIMRKCFSYLFYVLMSFVGEVHFLAGETDFRLIDKRVAAEFARLTEHSRITRGLINWLGFKKEYIHFTAPKRMVGEPGYDTSKLVSLVYSALLTHSTLPLRLAGYLGGFIILFSGLFGVFVFFEVYIFRDPLQIDPSGTALLAIMILFLSGITLGCIGLMSFYINNIRQEVVGRPLYIIGKTRNLN